MDSCRPGQPGRSALHLHPVHQHLPAAARQHHLPHGLLLEEDEREGKRQPEQLLPFLVQTFTFGCSVVQGAFWGLVVGLTVGCIRMLLDFIYPAPLCYEDDSRPGVLKYVHYLYFSILLSFITLAVVVGVSLATEEPTPEQVKRLSPLSPLLV